MLHLESFEPDHFFLVNGRQGNPTEAHRCVAEFYYNRSAFLDWTGKMKRSAFTAFDDDRVLGCAGVAILDGKGEVWMHISEELAGYPVWLTKTAAKSLIDVMRGCSAAAFFECFIPIGNTTNRLWIERALGFRDTGAEVIRGEECRHYTREVN